MSGIVVKIICIFPWNLFCYLECASWRFQCTYANGRKFSEGYLDIRSAHLSANILSDLRWIWRVSLLAVTCDELISDMVISDESIQDAVKYIKNLQNSSWLFAFSLAREYWCKQAKAFLTFRFLFYIHHRSIRGQRLQHPEGNIRDLIKDIYFRPGSYSEPI